MLGRVLPVPEGPVKPTRRGPYRGPYKYRGRKARKARNAIIHETAAGKFHLWKAAQRSVAKLLSSNEPHQLTRYDIYSN